MRKPTLAAAVAASVLGIAGVASASIPDSGGVIHGCRDTKSGALRVIDTNTGQTCGKGEAALNWSQTGPAGPSGVAAIQRGSTSTVIPKLRHTTHCDCGVLRTRRSV